MSQITGYKYVILLFFITLSFFRLDAQFVNYGVDPAHFKWQYVKTPHYKVIFPLGSDSTAYRYAQFLETVYPHLSKTIGVPKKANFPAVLHPANMQSNGMVAWAPRRMELITTPSSDLYAQSWDRQLAIHESRHVFQTGRLFQGIFKPLYYIAGEQVGGVVDLGVPKWFFEGDAVVIETAMSNSGRGRLPEFNMIYRAQMMSGNFFSFDKWAMGSYKDYTGNYYALGYDMSAFARYKYGADIWDKVLDRYAKRIYAIPPFSNALKHYTGVRTKGLFEETFTYLTEEWEKLEQENEKVTPMMPVSPTYDYYVSYKYPQPVNDTEVVAVKSGFKDINSLVLQKEGKEKHLAYLGSLSSRIIYNNEKIYWTEYVSGLRWTHENYSVLKSYDLFRGKISTLTPRKRYLAPAVSDDGKTVAVSCYTLSGTNEIVLLNSTTGKAGQTYELPFSSFVKEMTFAGSESLIALIVQDKGISIEQLNLHTGEWQSLLEPVSVNITSPVYSEGQLFFESGMNGTNNIYRMDIKTHICYRITDARFGVFQPAFSPDRKQLLVSDYQAGGYRITQIDESELNNVPVSLKEAYLFPLAELVSEQEQFNLDTATLQPVEFQSKPYRKASHLFHIHSWAPFYYDAADAVNVQADDFSTIVKPGAMVLSQNALNTAITQLGWYYKKGHHHGKLSFLYMGWYPVIDVNVDYGGSAFDVTWEKDEEGGEGAYLSYTGRNFVEAEARAYIPFNLTRNHWVKGFQPSVTYYYTNHRYQEYESRKYRQYQYLLSELRFYHYRRMAQRDILPRWGYQLRLQHLFAPANPGNFGNLYAARLTTYVPGLIKNDGLMLRFGYQYQDKPNGRFYIPERLLDKARGYSSYSARSVQQFTFKSDYSFNIWSPDFSIGSLAYLKRIRGNLFFDLVTNQPAKKEDWNTWKSYGGDLLFDWNALRLNYPISAGIRIINPIDYGSVQVEGLFSVSF